MDGWKGEALLYLTQGGEIPPSRYFSVGEEEFNQSIASGVAGIDKKIILL